MAKYIPLNRSAHADKAWKRRPGFGFAATEMVVPVVASELAVCATNMPLGFFKDGGTFHLAALLALRKGENLFVGPDGRWLGTYVPAAFRSYPFRLLRQAGADKLVLCINEAYVSTNADEGNEILFDADAKLSRSVRPVLKFLRQFEESRLATALAVNALADAGVIAPWPLKTMDRDKQFSLAGIFRVDEKRLKALDDAAFVELRRSGAIAVAYAQLLSTTRIDVLARLAKLQEKLKASKGSTFNLQDVFGDQDETLRFD